MKQMITAAIAALMLCSAPAAFAQGLDASSLTPEQTQAAMDMLKNMPADQKQQLLQSGADQMKNMSPEQLRQMKAKFDKLPPDQKKQIEDQSTQLYQNASPQTKAEVQQKMEALTPEEQRQLTGSQPTN